MEIKINCECGQKYIFSVDPENGRMPVAVNCPACGADGTREANEILAQVFAEPTAAPAAASPPIPPAPAAGGALRISASVSPAAPAGAPPPPLSAPRPIAPLKPAAGKRTLAWYEHVWAALPLGLVLVGGAIGGGMGGAAWVLNRAVLQKVNHPVLRYLFTGMISAAAVVTWLVLASMILGLLHRR